MGPERTIYELRFFDLQVYGPAWESAHAAKQHIHGLT